MGRRRDDRAARLAAGQFRDRTDVDGRRGPRRLRARIHERPRRRRAALRHADDSRGAVRRPRRLPVRPRARAEPVPRAVEGQAKAIAEIEASVAATREDVEDVRKVQRYTVEQGLWQADVLSHVAERKPGKPPPKPASLRELEREMVVR